MTIVVVLCVLCKAFVVAVNHGCCCCCSVCDIWNRENETKKLQTIRIQHDGLNAVSDLLTCCCDSLYYPVAAVMHMVS
jgi:hypothetical protein